MKIPYPNGSCPSAGVGLSKRWMACGSRWDLETSPSGLIKVAVASTAAKAIEAAIATARTADRTTVIVLKTDPATGTEAGGHWWDVAVPEISTRAEVRIARAAADTARQAQRLGN